MGGPNQDAISLARELIKKFESWSPTAYPDPPGQSQSFSIAWGHRITGADGLSAQSVVTQLQGDALLELDMQRFVDCVEANVTVPMSAPMEASLISFAYNEGCEAFKGSTLLRVVNASDWASVAAEFAKWKYDHVNGVLQVNADLEARRAQEAQIFSSGVPA
jgi:lysozyme